MGIISLSLSVTRPNPCSFHTPSQLDTSNKILELALGNPEEGIPSLGGHGVKVGVIDVDLPTYFPAYLLDDDEVRVFTSSPLLVCVELTSAFQMQITTPKDQAKIHLEQLKYIWDNLIESVPLLIPCRCVGIYC